MGQRQRNNLMPLKIMYVWNSCPFPLQPPFINALVSHLMAIEEKIHVEWQQNMSKLGIQTTRKSCNAWKNLPLQVASRNVDAHLWNSTSVIHCSCYIKHEHVLLNIQTSSQTTQSSEHLWRKFLITVPSTAELPLMSVWSTLKPGVFKKGRNWKMRMWWMMWQQLLKR